MPMFEQNYENWYIQSQNGLSGPKNQEIFFENLKSSIFNLDSLKTIRICIFRLIGPAKDDIFTKTISPLPPPPGLKMACRAQKNPEIF